MSPYTGPGGTAADTAAAAAAGGMNPYASMMSSMGGGLPSAVIAHMMQQGISPTDPLAMAMMQAAAMGLPPFGMNANPFSTAGMMSPAQHQLMQSLAMGHPFMRISGNASCHQCKTTKDDTLLLFCTATAPPLPAVEKLGPDGKPLPTTGGKKEGGGGKRKCRKKYCDSCLVMHTSCAARPASRWVNACAI